MKKLIYIATSIIFLNLVISAIVVIYTHNDFYEKLSFFCKNYKQRMIFGERLTFDYQLVKHNLLSDEGFITFNYLPSDKYQPIEITLSFKIKFLPFVTLVDAKFLNSTFDVFLLNELLDEQADIAYRGTYLFGDDTFKGKLFLNNVEELSHKFLDSKYIGQISIKDDGTFSFVANIKKLLFQADKYKIIFNKNMVEYSSNASVDDKFTFKTHECKLYDKEKGVDTYSFFDVNGHIFFNALYNKNNLKQIGISLFSKKVKFLLFDKVSEFFNNFMSIRVDDYNLDLLLSTFGLSQKNYSSLENKQNIQSPKIYFNSLGYDKDNFPFAINGNGYCVDCNIKSTKFNYLGKLNISVFSQTLNSYNDKLLLYSLKYINLWPCISYIRDKYKGHFYLESNKISCKDR